jgi:hypothetical protein
MSTLSNDPIICKYNGVVFGVETEMLDCTIKPVPDSAGRTVVLTEHHVKLKTLIAQANQDTNQTTDTTLASLRKKLTAYAAPFYFQNLGYGDLVVNVTPSGAWDVAWGPKPDLLSWKPIGAAQAAEVVWSVCVRVPECEQATYKFPGIMELNYKLTIDVDKSGYSTRTYAGFLRIPQTRASVSSRKIQHTADELRELINPGLLPGFRRIYGPFNFSEDKTRMDWSIKDEELGGLNYLPPGCIDATLENSLDSVNDLLAGGFQWKGSLSGTYELAKGMSPEVGFGCFLAALADRVSAINRTPFRGTINKGQVKQFCVVHTISLSCPNLYGRPIARGSAGYTFFSRLDDILKTASPWRQPPNSDWNTWALSLEKSGFNVRGNAGLKVLASDDLIVDLCQTVNSNDATLKTQLPNATLNVGDPNHVLRGFKNAVPNSLTSWLAYLSNVTYSNDDDTNELKVLPTSTLVPMVFPNVNINPDVPTNTLNTNPNATPTTDGAKIDATQYLPSVAQYAPLNNQLPQSSVQTRNRPSYYVTLQGHALRGGWVTAAPRLISVGGIAVVQANRDGIEYVRHVECANWFGVPLFFSAWRQRYLIPGIPTGDVFVPGTPLLA